MKINYVKMQELRSKGYSLQEVADVFGCSRQAVNDRERRMKKQGWCRVCLRPMPIVKGEKRKTNARKNAAAPARA